MRNLIVGITAAVVLGVNAAAAVAAPPENTVAPGITGAAREGATLTASRGSWTNSPSSYAFSWQRCDSDGEPCVTIPAVTRNTYVVQRADVGHTIRALVIARNADGSDSAVSEPTGVIASRQGPRSTARPQVTGDVQVGGELEVSNGSWSPAPASFAYQWQQCDTEGRSCVNIRGATGKTYGVRLADLGNRLRALVTARTQSGQQATAVSTLSPIVVSNTPPVATNRAPTVRFIALRRVGVRVYARFRVCDDGIGRVNVIQRDRKRGVRGYTRRFAVVVAVGCGSFTRSWVPAPRFRTRGRHIVTLRAIDKSRKMSRPVSRSIRRR